MDKYIVTIETGGTKSRITVFTSGGELEVQSECAGVGAVGNADLTDFMDKMNQLRLTVPFECVSNVIVNLGGTNTDQIREAVSPMFPNAVTEVYRESSGVIMKAICQMEKVDVLLMAGTGIICLACGDKGSMITDAWGVNIGDKGSGYWIGLESISRSLLALEKDKELPPLAKYITGRQEPFSGVDNTEQIMVIRDDVRKNFMPLERMKVAAFAKDAARFARDGDEIAMGIFRDAGVYLAETVIRGAKLAGCGDDASVLVSGGLIRCYDLWGESFEQTLNAQSAYTARVGEADMTLGMLYYITSRSNQH